MISFKANSNESRLSTKIAKRASKQLCVDSIDTDMTVIACHINGCELDLQKLLDAPDFDFAHDVLGIRSHLCLKTGKLKHNFVPRCAK